MVAVSPLHVKFVNINGCGLFTAIESRTTLLIMNKFPTVTIVLGYSKGLRRCFIFEYKLQYDGINSTVLHGLMTSLQTGNKRKLLMSNH